jgi:putative heme-binding domain-containing protein
MNRVNSLGAFGLLTAVVTGLAACAEVTPEKPGTLTLQKGDHICIIGNTLAERMQHYGWLETLIQARFPQHELVVRNLGYSGDQVGGYTDKPDPSRRMRSMDFGTADQWLAGSAPVPQPKKLSPRDQGKVRDNRFELTNTRADVIFAFFGYNESFAGEAGLPKFKQDIEAFIKHTQSQKYIPGAPGPRLVLFSPIAHEFINDPNLPGKAEVDASNVRLKTYSEAMGQVAQANGVLFVDLFAYTLPGSRKFSMPLADARTALDPSIERDRHFTIDGVHLNDTGDRWVSMIADIALFTLKGQHSSGHSTFGLHKLLRSAVKDKNFYWFQRYRTTDGYSTYGDRAFLKFAEGPGGYGEGLSNYSVLQRELEVLDVMTANRDKVVWAAAQGREIEPDDSNIPQFIPVISNKPGALPGGKHEFLSGEAEIAKMDVAKGMKVTLYADESMFPELVNPVQMAFDTRGRLWVAAWQTYPHWKPTEPMNDKLLILEDADGDGRADRCKTLAGDLHNPTGFEFWNGGVIVAQGPDVVFLKDTDGDDRYDVKERILHGLDTADTHHTANSFTFDPGGALYFQEGTFHHTQVETPWGPPVRLANAGVFRYEPRTHKFETYVSYPFANPHGHVWDRWGRDIVHDGTGANPYDGALFSGRIDFPAKHNRPPQVYQQRTRPCPGTEILSSRHFPPELQDTLLVGNVIGVQGILIYRISDYESSMVGAEIEPLVLSSDPNFRPADIEIGPDGAIYFTDWHNPIIGHMQHNLRDPSRDREHGRVYRVTYEGRPLLQPARIAGAPVEQLLELLKEPENRTRHRARIELSARPSNEVIAAVEKWIAKLDRSAPNYEHHMLEALWVFQQHNVVNEGLLRRMLASAEPKARAAATRVLCYWRDRVSDSLGLLKQLAADPHPRVRLEAVRAASFFDVPEAVEVPLVAAEQPTDQYIDFVRGETMRQIEPYWKKALADGRDIPVTTEAGARFFLRNTPTERLLAMDRTRAVCLELLFRPGLLDEHRRAALRSLAELDNKPELRVLIDAIRSIAEKKDHRDESVLFDLVRLLSGRSPRDLAAVRGDLEMLATSAKQPIIRQMGFVALLTVDGNADKARALAATSVAALVDFVNAVPLISDGGLRATLYPKLEPLLDGLPRELVEQASSPANSKGSYGRYVRVELPGERKTLTLAEIEVLSEGRNVARSGKATQSNVAHGGEPSRAIDGNKSGSYGDGGQTHTNEATKDPWWEVDLSEEVPIEAIVIYNRTDGQFGNRLDGFTLKVLDAGRSEVFKQEKIAAPDVKAEFALEGGGPAGLVRRAAMNALVSVRGQEAKTFQTLARFVRDDRDRLAAIRAMQRIPRTAWPKEPAAPLLDTLIAHVRQIPVPDRTSLAALDTLEFADALATLLPPDRAKQVRAELGELGVRVLRVGTLFERMSFDKDVMAVRAGKPVEFLFENTDLMPHNFVITQPGSLEEIGQAAEATATHPDAAARHYVPPSNKVLLASRLLQPRESQKLSFVAPQQPGVYPYVCTYPGHWRRMFGAMFVVENLDDYLANPEGYLAEHSLPVKDDLLKDRRPRTEWKFDDLAAAVEQLGHDAHAEGRSYNSGKHIFQVATCIACHRMEGTGNEFGPDLLKLDAKFTPTDILRELLDPSSRINEKFQTYLIETESGKILTGIILEETPDRVRIIENPLASTEPITLKPSEIAARQKSPTSIMPKGLLDQLTRDEILDLIAYVAARGDRNHELFRGGHGHAH